MNILLIGNGAREHAIAKAIKKSAIKTHIFAVGPKINPGITILSKDYLVASVTDTTAILDYAKSKDIDIAIPGPEAPLEVGIVDALLQLGIKSFGPTKNLAKLETSKSFTRNLLEKYQIPGNPKQKTFTSVDGLHEYIEELGQVVVKADGLSGGKGVKIMGEQLQDQTEAIDFAKECIKDGGRVVIEEKLEGQEFSYICFSDGTNILGTFPIQDHKRAFEEDIGPNTGGMGTYNDGDLSLPFIDNQDIEAAHSITEQVLQALRQETKEPYIGVMYGGFMKTAQGVKLIEYNARFGDPEAMNILGLMQSDFVEMIKAAIEGKLDSYVLEFEAKASVLKYVVPNSYPNKKEPLTPVSIDQKEGDFELYYGDIEEQDGQLFFGTSRGVGVLGTGEDLQQAEKEAEKGVESIQGNVRHRSDIGTNASIDKKIKHMQHLLS